MTPHLEEVEKQKSEAVSLKEKLLALRKSGAKEVTLTACRESIAGHGRTVEEALVQLRKMMEEDSC
jgi:hypothetical protein